MLHHVRASAGNNLVCLFKNCSAHLRRGAWAASTGHGCARDAWESNEQGVQLCPGGLEGVRPRVWPSIRERGYGTGQGTQRSKKPLRVCFIAPFDTSEQECLVAELLRISVGLRHTYREDLEGQIMLRGQLLSALAISAGLLASAKPAFKETFDGEMSELAYCVSRRH
jgi:hypothetical protein